MSDWKDGRIAGRKQHDKDFQRSKKAAPSRIVTAPTPINPRYPHPIKFIKIGRCATVMDSGGYCGAPCGGNAFRFCDFHADLFLNKKVRTR